MSIEPAYRIKPLTWARVGDIRHAQIRDFGFIVTPVTCHDNVGWVYTIMCFGKVVESETVPDESRAKHVCEEFWRMQVRTSLEPLEQAVWIVHLEWDLKYLEQDVGAWSKVGRVSRVVTVCASEKAATAVVDKWGLSIEQYPSKKARETLIILRELGIDMRRLSKDGENFKLTAQKHAVLS